MAPVPVSGAEGYAEEAETLFQQYESVPFADLHRQVIHLIPDVPGRILDIGSGTGRDAAAFVAMGHDVVAVEPTAELRMRAAALHQPAGIEWLDDSLPDLTCLTRRSERFDLVMLTAVWMHLDEQQRQQAMPRVARLVRRGGVMILSLRHGPVPPGRRMFDVSAEETIRLALAEGLALILKLENQTGFFGGAGKSWTRLAFSNAR
jgi:SAM-dependent methyltransferase